MEKKKRGRRKLKEENKKIRISITLDKKVYEEAKENIENISAYINKCLRNSNKHYKKVNEEKSLLRIMSNRLTNEEYEKKVEALYRIASTKWIDR